MKLTDAIAALSTYSDKKIIYIKSTGKIDADTETAVLLSNEFERM